LCAHHTGCGAQAKPENSWLTVKIANDILSAYPNNATNEKWKGKLTGLDVYGRTNAAAIFEAVLIDWESTVHLGSQTDLLQGHEFVKLRHRRLYLGTSRIPMRNILLTP